MNRAGKRAWELVKREMHQTGTGYIKGQLREELRGELSSKGLEEFRFRFDPVKSNNTQRGSLPLGHTPLAPE